MKLSPIVLPEDGIDMPATVERIEVSLTTQALERTGGNVSRAAKLLGVKRSTLDARIRVRSRRPMGA